MTILEILELDTTEPNVVAGYSIRDFLLFFNCAGFFGSALFFVIVSVMLYRYEIKKLGKPYSEEEMMDKKNKLELYGTGCTLHKWRTPVF